MTISATLWLGQLQFFTSLVFLAVFLALELGLAWVLCALRVRALAGGASGQSAQAAYRYWVRFFALITILALAAGLPVLIQSGTIWPGLIPVTADVTVPLIAAAAITVFVFKSCFLGAMLFGQPRLAGPVHGLVVLMTAIGTTAWVFWLLVLFSWLHTPTGVVWEEQAFHVVNWRDVIFNPALGWYGLGFVAVSFTCTAGLLLVVSVAQSRRRPPETMAALGCRLGLAGAVVGALLVIGVIDGVSRLSAQHLPARAAAAVGHVDSQGAPDLLLLAWPTPGVGQPVWSWVWPDGGRRWLGRDAEGWRGQDEFTGMSPPVPVVYWAVRAVALSIGLLVVCAACLSWWLMRARFDGAALSRLGRWAPYGVLFGGLGLLTCGLAYVYFGALPYAVQGVITVQEVAGNPDGGMLLVVYLCHLAVYLVLALGFIQLVRHGIRYGFVPVARVRRPVA